MGKGQCKVSSFPWIQGESDAETDKLAIRYEGRLALLGHHIRRLLNEPNPPVILSVDELHPWVKQRPVVVESQKKIVAANSRMAFLSMQGLQKIDESHLSPQGIIRHGELLF